MIYRVNHVDSPFEFKNDAFKYLNAEEIGINLLLFYLKKKKKERYFFNFCNENDKDKVMEVYKSYIDKKKLKKEISDKSTIIDTYFISDPNLSLLSKGILLYMLTKPNNWQFYISTIAKDTHVSPQKVNKAIEELTANKYLTRKKIKRGHIKCYDFTVYEVPYGFELDLKEVNNNENNIPNKQE